MTPRTIGKVLLYSGAGFLGLVLVLMLAVKFALFRAPRYQAEIKEWVHGQLGYRIAFASVSPAFRWYGPELFFDRLELRSKDDQRVIARAAGGRIAVDIWQLLHSGRLLAGRIELESPRIVIVRIDADRFALAAEIDLKGGGGSLSLINFDDLPAGALAIRGGRIVVQNWNDKLPLLELRDVKLDLRRGDDVAALGVTATLPDALGGSVSLTGSARGTGSLDSVDWQAVTRVQTLSLAGWRDLLPEYLGRLGGGTGGFELAAHGRGGSLASADLDFNAANVSVQLGDEPTAQFEQISGAFSLGHAADRWSLTGRRVRALRGGRRDRDSEFDASWRDSAAGLLELAVRASYLRAETLLPLAGLLPQKDLRERLQEVAPSGEWMDARVTLRRAAIDAPWQLDVGARFRGVGFAPLGRAPGLRGLDGAIAGTDQGGRVEIEGSGGVFSWPAQLSAPIALERLKTTLYWQRTPAELLVATPSLDLKTADAQLQAKAAWHQPEGGDSPSLTLAATLSNGNVAETRRYLPRALLHPNVLSWLDRALVAGHLSHADVVFQGPIRHFPFRDGSGLFLARMHLDGMTIDYQDGWPRTEDLACTAEFRNEGMTAQLVKGKIGNVEFHQGELRFVDFKTAELKLRLAGDGDAADALGYLRATPLDGLADHAFSAVDAAGPMGAEVDLFLPFKQFDQRRILVHTHLRGVTLTSPGSPAAATELTGDADVEGAHVVRADVHGKLLGGNFQMQARAPRNHPLTRTVLLFNGNVTGEALHAALSLPSGAPIRGATDWHGVLRMASEPRERSLRLTATLAGLELDLPDPLAKATGNPLPTSVDGQWPDGGGFDLRVKLGSVVRGQFKWDAGANGPTFGHAALTFGPGPEAAFSDTQTVNAGGTIDRLDLAGWLRLYVPDKNARPAANFLRAAKFEVARIDYLGLSFENVALDLNLNDAGWRIGVGGPNVEGSISLPATADSNEPWKLEFKHLKFFAQDAPAGPQASMDADGANPRRIPAVMFHSGDTYWGERQFGDVHATLAKLEDGIALKQLSVRAATFSIDAKGEWRGREAGAARIEGSLTSGDVGGTLRQLNYDAVLEAKSGKLDFDLNWQGAPTGQALAGAGGHVQVDLDKGQITGLKPGAGRVVGLTSIAALPRRLALDFSDLTDKGFAFDTVRGDFFLRDGSAYTDNVLVKGPAAEIGLIGRIGLKNKDYDQTAVVTGNVGSTLPLAAFAGGPVIGAAVLVFTQVFKQPLKGLARGYYRITGSWDNPTVERIKSAEAAAATAEAPK